MHTKIGFIGGGNMACAIISGLLAQGFAAEQFVVVEPFDEARQKLQTTFGIEAQPSASETLLGMDIVVWAVKPQTFKEATQAVLPYATQSLHLSVAAGITSSSISSWLNTERVVRAMPNTPALIGKGITGLFARSGVSGTDRSLVSQVISSTSELLWLEEEGQLDAVTAISGSGPAYVFYFMESMTAAGVAMGLSSQQAYQLAVATFIGAGELARSSNEPPEVLRQRVTSKGGTTYAALTSMEEDQVQARFIKAMRAAGARAAELGQEFGG